MATQGSRLPAGTGLGVFSPWADSVTSGSMLSTKLKILPSIDGQLHMLRVEGLGLRIEGLLGGSWVVIHGDISRTYNYTYNSY